MICTYIYGKFIKFSDVQNKHLIKINSYIDFLKTLEKYYLLCYLILHTCEYFIILNVIQVQGASKVRPVTFLIINFFVTNELKQNFI